MNSRFFEKISRLFIKFQIYAIVLIFILAIRPEWKLIS